jgi:hypothetical protein
MQRTRKSNKQRRARKGSGPGTIEAFASTARAPFGLDFPVAKVINGRNYFQWDDKQLISAPKLRELLGGISAVSLWRWRHRKRAGRAAKHVQEWMHSQPLAA